MKSTSNQLGYGVDIAVDVAVQLREEILLFGRERQIMLNARSLSGSQGCLGSWRILADMRWRILSPLELFDAEN